jgi:hypothetical protein
MEKRFQTEYVIGRSGLVHAPRPRSLQRIQIDPTDCKSVFAEIHPTGFHEACESGVYLVW